MVIFGYIRRAIMLGAKVDDCASCHAIGPHALVRVVTWFTVFFVPVVPLWIRHGLVCRSCGTRTGVSYLRLRRGLKAGRLPLADRPRPDVATYVTQQWADHGEKVDVPQLLDPVTVNRERQPWNLYLIAWPFLVAALVAIVIVNPFGTRMSAGELVDRSRGGECLTDPTQAGSEVAQATEGPIENDFGVVDCAKPHTYEVLTSFDAPYGPGATQPPDDGWHTVVDPRCDSAFEDYVGTTIDLTALRIMQIVPSPEGWASGERRVLCMVYDPYDANHVGTWKGSAPAVP